MRLQTQAFQQSGSCDRKSYFPYATNGMSSAMHAASYYDKCSMWESRCSWTTPFEYKDLEIFMCRFFYTQKLHLICCHCIDIRLAESRKVQCVPGFLNTGSIMVRLELNQLLQRMYLQAKLLTWSNNYAIYNIIMWSVWFQMVRPREVPSELHGVSQNFHQCWFKQFLLMKAYQQTITEYVWERETSTLIWEVFSSVAFENSSSAGLVNEDLSRPREEDCLSFAYKDLQYLSP